ncbi:MAG: hypothetical protein P9M13_00535 [Candidatus Ancaeobacter aquaticus]|nr:hypothetical protein [Candidatus Ancaeobacter aquaticus]
MKRAILLVALLACISCAGCKCGCGTSGEKTVNDPALQELSNEVRDDQVMDEDA